MNVLVDTSIWSAALRRPAGTSAPEVSELAELVKEGRATMMGPVRQELLSGVRTEKQFQLLRNRLRAFPDVVLSTGDYEDAAAFYNRCRAKGIQGSSVDLLICAVAHRRGLSIFTSDGDFAHYARLLELRLHAPRA